MKADAGFWRCWWWGHELPDGLEHDGKLLVVLAQLAFELVELASQVFVGGHELAQPHEGAHDGNVNLDGAVAVEDAGEHGNTLLGEGVRQVLDIVTPASRSQFATLKPPPPRASVGT